MSQTNKTFKQGVVQLNQVCVFWTGLWMLKFASKDQRSTTLFVGNGNVVDC